MHKIALFIDDFFCKNRIFDLADLIVNWDNMCYQHKLLQDELIKHGYQLDTYDLSLNAPLQFYYNYFNPLPLEIDEKYLFIWEPVIVQPQLYDLNYHAKFKKIFTFCDDLIDNKKYFKINYSFLIPKVIPKDLNIKQKLCTLIAGNKQSTHELELYSKRYEAISWFEKNHPQDFDLYGRGWEYQPSNKVLKSMYDLLNKFSSNILRQLIKKYPSFKGVIDSKVPVLKRYKFAICYENAMDIPGYITEKMFHCFFAGCVPIYWGANNITDYVPSSCFIDKRNFGSYQELYNHINNINDQEYMQYLNNIEVYLNSEQVKQFSAEHFASSVIREVLDGKE